MRFPQRRERRANMGTRLSGGAQQMAAIGRALVLNPRLLLLDEPTEGLAPSIVEALLATLKRIVRDEGMAAVVVEQHARTALAVTDRGAVLQRGHVAGASADLLADPHGLDAHLGVVAALPA